jgi:ABC-2 type transporter
LGKRLRLYAEITRTGFLLYLADNPLRVAAVTTAPRLVLQGVFYVLIGRILDGASGSVFAFVGVTAYAACTSTVIGVCDVPMTDEWAGTYYRVQAGAVAPGTNYLFRAVPYAVAGFVSSLLVVLVDGPVLGLTGTLPAVLAELPIYLLLAATSTAFGLALAALAVGSGRDVLYGNLGTYLLLACAAVIGPLGARLHWVALVGTVLPLSHGLRAVHLAMAGAPWTGQALREVLVGAAWLAVALLVVRGRDRMVRSGGRPLAFRLRRGR